MNQNWLPSIFNDFFNNEWMMKANATAPAINVIENEKDYKIQLAGSGNDKKNDFTVNVDENNNLVICMEKKEEKNEEKKTKKNTYAVNFSYSKFNKVSYCRTMLKR